jgi:hypothetical protein
MLAGSRGLKAGAGDRSAKMTDIIDFSRIFRPEMAGQA